MAILKSKGRILIVEDEVFGERYKSALIKAGYSPILITDGRSALKEIRGRISYHIALVDLGLPNIDGNEIIEESKRINPETKTICISAYKHLPKNADYRIRKTISNQGLIIKVEKVIMSASLISRL